MRVPLEVEKAIEQQKIAAYVVGHLPIIKSYAVKIGLVDIINELVPSKMDVDLLAMTPSSGTFHYASNNRRCSRECMSRRPSTISRT